MIFLASQLQRFGRGLRIWIILLGLIFYLWFDSKKWTYLKGYTAKRKEKSPNEQLSKEDLIQIQIDNLRSKVIDINKDIEGKN